ncbi:hypothetical protein M422DRAFT_32296 [Sphaerobolus stellatus SS14]|uniref:Uncharacterized protein n=1 Tax=Sphaerobolus stellatus (strain SS14) TaxID=990650 RepID=A0A0C9UAR0_SPHS4|nr:hypothetical protein M422DRAFT_32296 [Sphaerobolus stellatus SS14]
MGSIFSAIGRGINAIISAIAGVIETIVSAITSVTWIFRSSLPSSESLEIFSAVDAVRDAVVRHVRTRASLRADNNWEGRRIRAPYDSNDHHDLKSCTA